MKINIHAHYTIDSARDGRQSRMGTGFVFLRKDWVVTAKHVVWDDQNQRLREPINLISTDPKIKEQLIRVKKYFLHPNIGLAILEAESAVCNLPFYPAHQKLDNNDDVVGVGYSPDSSGFTNVNFKALSLRGVESHLRERDSGDEELFEFESQGSEPGNSGGPILGVGAGVLAVIGHGIVGGDNGMYRVRATSIQTVIDSLNLTLEWNDV